MSLQVNGVVVGNDSREAIFAKVQLTVYSSLSSLQSSLPSGTMLGALAYVADANGGEGGLYYWGGSSWEPAGSGGTTFGSGGIKTESSGYTFHVFGEGTDTFSWTGGPIEVLMVGGGGGGGAGRSGGGGGAGGLAVRTINLSPGNHTVVVGSGGIGETLYNGPIGSRPNNNTSGGDTYISTNSGEYKVNGGGRGSYASGGSGGGGDSQANTGAGSAQPSGPNSYGYPGGSAPGSFPSAPNLSAYLHGAGGGGSSEKGQDSPRGSVTNGRGGQGHAWTSMSALNPSGSGAAWTWQPTWAPAMPSPSVSNGICGGGAGGRCPSSPQTNNIGNGGGGNATNGYGLAATSIGGGGGGGGWNFDTNYTGGNGMKGILIARYRTPS